jgi:hypothetical protein
MFINSIFLRPDTLDLRPEPLDLSPHESRCDVPCTALQQGLDYVFTARLANVGRAEAHGLRPEFVVRQAMGTNNTKFGKLTMEILNLAGSRNFQIDYHCIGTMQGDCGTDFRAIFHQTNGIEMLRQSDRQNLCRSDVTLIEDYREWIHTFPLTTPQFRGDLGCDRWETAQAFGVVNT